MDNLKQIAVQTYTSITAFLQWIGRTQDHSRHRPADGGASVVDGGASLARRPPYSAPSAAKAFVKAFLWPGHRAEGAISHTSRASLAQVQSGAGRDRATGRGGA
jgi:hypothetical protein